MSTDFLVVGRGHTFPAVRGVPRGGLPLRYVRDLRPLTAIPLDASSASLHTPPHSRTMVAPWGTPDETRPGSTAWPPRCAPRISCCGGTPAARSTYRGVTPA